MEHTHHILWKTSNASFRHMYVHVYGRFQRKWYFEVNIGIKIKVLR